jgi:hypothetical protein
MSGSLSRIWFINTYETSATGIISYIDEIEVTQTYMIQRSCQVFRTASMCQISISRMSSEKFFLLSQCVFHGVPSINILLTPVDHPDESQLQWVCPPGQDIQRVCARIHQVEFRQHSDGS